MIVESAREVSIERGRLRVVLATIAINIVAVSLLVFAPWSNWRTGLALNLVDNCLLVGFALVRRDELLGRFVIFGLAVGITELAADAWLVDYTRNARLFSRRRADDLAFAALDAAGVGSGCRAIWIHRTAIVGTVRSVGSAAGRAARCDQHSVL